MAGAAALGLFRELRTQPARNRPRTSRRGQVEHKPVATSLASARPPQPAHSPRATSCRNCRPSPCDRLSRPRSTTTAPPRPRLRLASRLSTPPSWQEDDDGTETGGSRVHCHPVSGSGIRLCPCGLATATPQPFAMASHPRLPRPGQEFPALPWQDGCAPQPSPYPPDLSWRYFKRRNNTGFSRTPSRFAHRARPVR